MARDGIEAVGMIQVQHFDLVVSDIKMPTRVGTRCSPRPAQPAPIAR